MQFVRRFRDFSHLRVVKVPRAITGPILDLAGKKVIGVFFTAYGVRFLFHKPTKEYPYSYTVTPMFVTDECLEDTEM